MHLSSVTHRCACSVIDDDASTPHLALHSSSLHVQRKLQVLLATLAVPHEPLGDAYHLAPGAAAQLAEVAAALLPSEVGDVHVAPCTDGQVNPWAARPLRAWVTQFGSPWFAAACGALHMHLQPIADLRRAEVYGYEALMRGAADGRTIGAGELIAAAEARGQLRALDALARTTAITQAYPLLPPDTRLFINFAPGVVYNPDVCLQTTFRACAQVGADVGRLVFEVTESEAFPDLTLLRRILDRYRREGAQVALDDLGAGHTSLTYLSELRPDIVKLDRDLIRGLTGTDPRLDLVGALVRYAHELGIRVVAEGIETATELDLVRALNVDYAQGYHLARPAMQPAPLSSAARQQLQLGVAVGS